ncbi:efflux RND transporter permease subunit [Clostridium sp. DJ247]|uniref:efflux RND transporter permease subunit n=1 Tax=Clostridium sp. DJ247 TaxID=2726188 RepID=UPI001627F652|nr:efflux RND transporter permease subunit [Clostridium sp. DJ247]MBC2580385.1 efflux RND transporter permease subunit [Clostridium sp. DJ247]
MIKYLVRRRKITIVFFVMVVFAGFVNFLNMPKQESPDVSVNLATIITVLPGASPEKIEQTVTKKIEENIKGISGIKTITSHSTLGVSSITVEAQDKVDTKDVWNKLRNKVKDAEKDLPKDTEVPVVNDDLERSFVQSINITAETQEQLYSLRDLVKNWKDQLRTIPKVADVTIDGLPNQEVTLEVSAQKLKEYGISQEEVMNAVQSENERVPLGNFDNDGRSFQLSLPENRNVDELNKVIIKNSKDGFPIYIKDIGKIFMSTEKVKSYAYHNGKPCITISINAEVGTDIPSLQKRVDAVENSLKKSLPAWSKVENVYSQNERIDELFTHLGKETCIAILSVLLVCSLGLNLITSFIIALAIPISLGVGLTFAPQFNITLNEISILALIIVLGILVDDAVVVNDNIERRLSVLGEPPTDAAVNGCNEVFYSILSATLATMCSFGPLAFLDGDAGKFIHPIPIIITLTMAASMIMSLSIIPIFREWYEKRHPKDVSVYTKPPGLLGKYLVQLSKWYGNVLMPKILKRPLKVAFIAMTISILSYSLALVTPIELFPNSDRAEMLVNISTSAGSSIKETNTVVKKVSDWISKQPNITLVSAYAGQSAPKMFNSDDNGGSGNTTELGQIVVRVDKNKTTTAKVTKEWAEKFKTLFPEARVVPEQLKEGPPVGDPVSIRIYGQDIDTLRKLSQQLKDKLATISGTYDVADDMGIANYTLEFQVDKGLMDKKLVSYKDLSSAIRLVSEGTKVSQFDDGKNMIDIKMFVEKSEQNPILTFQQLSVTNALGQQIPLSQIAQIRPTFSINQIPHRNLSRVVTVTAKVKNRTATDVMDEAKVYVQNIKFPEGYRWEEGGETSEQTDIFSNMGELMIIAIFLIVLIITIQFYSLAYPILIMSTIFLAFAGSFLGLFITQKPLGFMSMMGAVSLIGIVVRNGIVLLEFIENERHRGVGLHQAVINAGEARLRPVILTAATAIAGLLSLALSGDVLFSPLAITIIFGLLFSTILTLVVVPALYTALANYQMKKKNKNVEESNLNTNLIE